MKRALCILLFFIFNRLGAQTPDPRVINSAGGTRTAANGISITDNVGEPFTQTFGPISNVMITEGYLQPFAYIAPGFSVSILKNDLSCSDKKDGSVTVDIQSQVTNYSATYVWTPASVCPGNNCAVINDLLAGTYSVAIHITYTTSGGFVKQDSSFQSATVADLNGPCLINVYHGVTPNNDGINDVWTIGNIDAYKTNKVSIFNRWGVEVYSAEGYDNKSKVWNPADTKLPSSTYFYVIDLGNGGKPIKGWVELIKD